MCGIAGIAAIDSSRVVAPEALRPMLDSIAHHGPDDRGTFTAAGAVFGHVRLSIIDLESGAQPMCGATRDTVIVSNGEIYNFRALRHELEARGHRFRTASDTEVAVRAYDQWGVDFLTRLDGMYALAIWDERRRRLLLARDRMGEKPLYWGVFDGLLLFGSELRAVAAHPAVDGEIDPVALSQYLALEYVPAPRSILRGVRKLEPGTACILEDGAVRTWRYYEPRIAAPASSMSYAAAVRQLRLRLESAVRTRLVSDVPVGVLLSGGVDSSAVAALAAREGSVATFSLGFAEPSFDERGWARSVAGFIGSDHREQVALPSDALAIASELGGILDEPLGDASILPMVMLSRTVRGHVKVALGGDGGDELFAGYPMHQAHRVAPIARALPSWLHHGAAWLTDRLPVSHRNFSAVFRLQRFLRGARLPAPMNHAAWMASFLPHEQLALLSPDVLAACRPDVDALESIERAWRESDGGEPLARATRLDAGTYLPDDILTKVDRASMSVALEVRSPMLAPGVVDFALGLPDSFRMPHLTGKRLLRDAVADILPREVVRRRKKGFGMPVGAWLKDELSELLCDTLSANVLARSGLFRPAEAQRLVAEHLGGRADHRKQLWTLLVFELWRTGRRPQGGGVPRGVQRSPSPLHD